MKTQWSGSHFAQPSMVVSLSLFLQNKVAYVFLTSFMPMMFPLLHLVASFAAVIL